MDKMCILNFRISFNKTKIKKIKILIAYNL
jgi:hypothetical protein